MTTTHAHRATAKNLHPNPSDLLRGLQERWNNYWQYRRTLNELSALDDRQLRDLGLNRSMLQRIAWQAAYEAR